MLAAIAVATHPLLDYLNTYGMRWFMPVIDRWYYGDVLFIVDPWMWAILAAGVVLGWRKRARFGAGGAALVVAGLYVLAMAIGSGMARRVAWERLASEGATRLMVAPAPLNPFRRMVVAEVRGGGAYRFGGVSLWPRPSIEMDDVVVPVEWPGPARLAAATPEGATFLHWARFPFTEIETASDSVTVHFIDARYTLDANASFGAIRIKVPVDHAVAR
jgi:inner membrane protein